MAGCVRLSQPRAYANRQVSCTHTNIQVTLFSIGTLRTRINPFTQI